MSVFSRHVTTSHDFPFLHLKADVLVSDFRFPFRQSLLCRLQLQESLRMISHFSSSSQIFVLLCCTVCGADISCRNEDGEAVDW